jgi:histidinol-phosphatase (PHP family)
MLATYHNHSTWSDGKATPAELLSAARAMSIGELGISDHWVLHPKGTQPKWAMPASRLGEYVVALRALNDDARRQGGPIVRIGLEVDWFPGQDLRLRKELDKHNFDYLIGSVHEVNGFVIDMSRRSWESFSSEQCNEIHRQYWINVKSLAESGLFDIAAHIDLPKKFAFYPTIDLSREIDQALDAVAAAPRPLVVELNTAGWHKPCADAYPTPDILRGCHRRDIRLTISADAHQADHLLRDFKRAAERLAAAGYAHVARFANRKARFEPLGAAIAGL